VNLDIISAGGEDIKKEKKIWSGLEETKKEKRKLLQV